MRKPTYLFLLFLLFLSISHYRCSEKQTRPPNIILILADDLGYRELGCYGQEIILTPNIDRLAEEGMRFTQFYSGSTVCAPSRCVLLTGKHTGHAYVRDNYELGGWLDEDEGGQLPLPEGTTTLATLLKDRGYATGVVGKWGLGGPGSVGVPTKQGFDFFYGYLCQKQAHNYYPTHLWKNEQWDTLNNSYFSPHQKFEGDENNPASYEKYKGKDYAQDKMTEEALNFIRESRAKPFLLYLPFPVPHVAIQVPDEALAPYTGKLDTLSYKGEKGYLPHPAPRAAYAAMITRMDQHIGSIMDMLRELNLDDNTIVVFTSDNGTTFAGGVEPDFFKSTGELRGLKMSQYEGGIRVPMVVWWPGKVEAGSTSDYIGSFQDFIPTIMEITDGETPDDIDGISFLPTLGNKSAQETHPYLYWEFHTWGGFQTVRKGKWKAIRKDVDKYPESLIELYDLSIDISETNDLAEQYPDIVNDMINIMDEAHTPSETFPFPGLDSIKSLKN